MNITLATTKHKSLYWATPILLSVFLCLASKIRIFLPFSPVPITLQVHLILLFSYLLGSKRAVVMTSLFLLQGTLGFSVFATGGGLACLMGPTGGYLVGYLVASFVTGSLNNKSGLKAMGIGNLIVYFFGWLHLCQFVGCTQAVWVGIIPFVITDSLKLLFAGGLARHNAKKVLCD